MTARPINLSAYPICKTCRSTSPHMHPAVQHEGEVEICTDEFHLISTPQNGPKYIAMVNEKRRAKGVAQ